MEQEIKRDFKAIKKFGKEFKTFISKGNVIDLAVGVIIGGAFGKIVTSLVNDLIMPIIGTLLGGLDFTNLSLTLWGDASINYGSFIQNIVDFLIIAFFIFLFVKIINKLTPKPAPAPVKDTKAEKSAETQIALLTEIRDNLKKK